MIIAHTVRCRVPDEPMAEKYRHWLQEGHLRDVCDAGALSAQLVELNEPEHCFEARYFFADRSLGEVLLVDVAEAPGS